MFARDDTLETDVVLPMMQWIDKDNWVGLSFVHFVKLIVKIIYFQQLMKFSHE